MSLGGESSELFTLLKMFLSFWGKSLSPGSPVLGCWAVQQFILFLKVNEKAS